MRLFSPGVAFHMARKGTDAHMEAVEPLSSYGWH